MVVGGDGNGWVWVRITEYPCFLAIHLEFGWL
jgi:hypothetical protein